MNKSTDNTLPFQGLLTNNLTCSVCMHSVSIKYSIIGGHNFLLTWISFFFCLALYSLFSKKCKEAYIKITRVVKKIYILQFSHFSMWYVCSQKFWLICVIFINYSKISLKMSDMSCANVKGTQFFSEGLVTYDVQVF